MGVFSDSRIVHDLSEELRKEDFPCLTYIRDLTDWHDFIRRTPEEYEAWIDGVSKECETLELKILSDMSQEEKPIFVDTNISIETLRTIADHHHVLIMEEPDPEQALENYRQSLMRIHSQERYDRFLYSGFHVIHRDENRSIEQTLTLVEKAFDLR